LWVEVTEGREGREITSATLTRSYLGEKNTQHLDGKVLGGKGVTVGLCGLSGSW